MISSDSAANLTPLCLTPEEEKLLHHVACRLIENATLQQPVSINEFDLGRLTKYPLVGAFVTLRKQGELRGCIGNFTESTPLDLAIERAAIGVVSHDPRFPQVGHDELVDLTVTVSLLHTRELVEGSPEQRSGGIAIGQHGLDIQYEGRKGLLLPSVATDHGLNTIQFLQAVCRKATLPDDAWQEPDATLYRFSALAVGGPWVPA